MIAINGQCGTVQTQTASKDIDVVIIGVPDESGSHALSVKERAGAPDVLRNSLKRI